MSRLTKRADNVSAAAGVRADALRTNRVKLRSPVVKADGSKVYEGVLVTKGDVLDYGDREEIVTAEAINDPAYLDALSGLTLTIKHPEGDEVTPYVIESGEARTAGAVLSARVESDAVVIRLWVQREEDQRIVEQYGELSEGYYAKCREEGGKILQVGRVPNHVAIVPAGRAPSAVIQVDGAQRAGEGEAMEEKLDKVLEMLAGMLAANADMVKRFDAYMSKDEAGAAAPAPKMDEETAAAVAEELAVDSAAMRADAKKARQVVRAAVDQIVTERVKQISQLRADAEARGVGLPVDVTDPAVLRKALAVALGADAKRADSADYCDGVIKAAPLVTGDGLRADSAQSGSLSFTF